MTKITIKATTTALRGEDGVERPAPGAAPIAFRLFRAGENPTSKGLHVFTRRSAELILEEDARRQTLYSIDVDHASLDPAAPPENHRAVGWHRLEVRESPVGPELWAVALEWSPEARAELEKQPPGFAYFSPAYDVVRETGEIVGYCNVALTNNPATYGCTRIAAARQITTMTDLEAVVHAACSDAIRKHTARSAMTSTVRANAHATAAVLASYYRDGEGPSKPLQERLAEVETEIRFEEVVRGILDELGAFATEPTLPQEQRDRARAAIEALSKSGAEMQRKAASASLQRVDERVEIFRGMGIPMRAASRPYDSSRGYVFPLRLPSEARATARGTATATASRAPESDSSRKAPYRRVDGSWVFPLRLPSESRGNR